jgi:CheY-like chemotaxis protein
MGSRRSSDSGPIPERGAIPVMAMTASIMTAGPDEMRAAGFDGYQSKPLQVKEFLAAVEQLLEKST